MKVISVGSKEDNILLEIAISDLEIPLQVINFHQISSAFTYLIETNDSIDLLVINSGAILLEGVEVLIALINNEKLKNIHIVILTEFEGEEKYLSLEKCKNTFVMHMPVDYDGYSLLINRIIDISKNSKNQYSAKI